MRSQSLPGSEWSVILNAAANMAYIWLSSGPVGDTYVDYDHEIQPDVAYALKSADDDRVVGIFVRDLKAVLDEGKRLEREQRESLMVGLVADRRWSIGKQPLTAAR